MAKTRLPSLAVFFVLLVLLIEVSWAQDLEVLEAISEHMSEEVQEELLKILEGPQPTGVNDPSLSNSDVNEQIAELLFSGDSEKVKAGLTQLNAYVEFVHWNSQAGERAPVSRDFASISGLKEFLIWRWREEIRESDGIPPRFQASPDVDVEDELEIMQDVEKFKEWMNATKPPAWITIPFILAVVFPGDSEVHEVIWESHDPSQPGGTLNALTMGRFTTPEATALRIEALFAESDDFLAHFSANAARGLGRCQTDEGFHALVRRMEGLNEILLASIVVEAIVAYGTKALAHRDELTKIGARFQVTAEVNLTPPTTNVSTTPIESESRYRLHRALKSLERLAKFHERRSSMEKSAPQEPINEDMTPDALNSGQGAVNGVDGPLSTPSVSETTVIYQIEWDNRPSPREMYFTLTTDIDGNFHGEWTDSNKKTFQVENLKIQDNTFYFTYQLSFDVEEIEMAFDGTFDSENFSGRMFMLNQGERTRGNRPFSGHRKSDKPPVPKAVEIEPFAPLTWNDGLYTVLVKSNDWTDVKKRFIECKGSEAQDDELRMEFDTVTNDKEFTKLLDKIVETTMSVQGEDRLSRNTTQDTATTRLCYARNHSVSCSHHAYQFPSAALDATIARARRNSAGTSSKIYEIQPVISLRPLPSGTRYFFLASAILEE